MSEIHFHSIQDYEISVWGIKIDAAKSIKYPHFLYVREKGISTGVYLAIIQKKTFKGSSGFFGLFNDVRIINGPTLKMCQFVPPNKFEPNSFNDSPYPGDICRVHVDRIRLKRAHFKPHLRRRLKAVRR